VDEHGVMDLIELVVDLIASVMEVSCAPTSAMATVLSSREEVRLRGARVASGVISARYLEVVCKRRRRIDILIAPVYVWTVAKRSVSILTASVRFSVTGDAMERPLRAKREKYERCILVMDLDIR